MQKGFLSKKPYEPPSWTSHLSPIPSHTFTLGHFPTPIHKWNLPNLPEGTEVWIKRDDLSGMELSGNKARKLEFLMADVVSSGADCVITLGGMQSNHCRATAVAARCLNLDCHLIFRSPEDLEDKDPGLVGNLMLERLVGAHIYFVSVGDLEFFLNSMAIANSLKNKLEKEGRKPYIIPPGGSNSLGNWAYIEAIREIEQQVQNSEEAKFDDIVVACGSGGTCAGISLGSRLSSLKAKVHAFAVVGTTEYFYYSTQKLIDGLQSGLDSHEIVDITDVQGLGYAISTEEELQFIKEIAQATGIILDPVYSGKAAYGMFKDMASNPEKWRGRKVLFIHTGGLLGLYDRTEQIAPLVGECHKLEIDKSIPWQDLTGKLF
ncbi:hypothetical protein LUZ63_013024 [Rhynchospora breviuscula]|uniref:D-cysteine desulfhydrase n=1 Tax=Rhynchospora breviuscula TaxID=2022672 RepID=A0A9Q0C7U9_9POAL|nr:hypothetical protein LUZ63_013024 [Rhynchospora breviuscula]